MSDLSSMNRENKKRQLRRQMIDSEDARRASELARHGGGGPRRSQEDGRRFLSGRPESGRSEEEEIVRAAEKRVRRRRLKIAAAVVAAAVAAAGGFAFYTATHQYTGYGVVWESPMAASDTSFVRYVNFEDNVLKYTKDGASYINGKGETVWSKSYEMKSPVCYVNQGSAVIADRQGTGIYIFDESGCQGEAQSLLPIQRAAVSAYGVTAVMTEDAKASYAAFYKKDGSSLDWNIKSILSGDGYQTDISVSPEGTQVMVAYACLKNGNLSGKVVFYNFSEVGKNYKNRVVGGFDEIYEGSLVPRVRFLDEEHACAIADNGISFYSLRNIASPELVAHVPVEEEIVSVGYSDKYVACTTPNGSGLYDYTLYVYKADGTLAFSKDIDFQYRYMDIDGDNVILYNESSCRVYNMSGVEKFKGEFDFSVSHIRPGRMPGTLMVTGPETMKEIRMK